MTRSSCPMAWHMRGAQTLKPKALNPKPQTLASKPSTRNLRSQTLDPKALQADSQALEPKLVPRLQGFGLAVDVLQGQSPGKKLKEIRDKGLRKYTEITWYL